jgi:hypothetical protein
MKKSDDLTLLLSAGRKRPNRYPNGKGGEESASLHVSFQRSETGYRCSK